MKRPFLNRLTTLMAVPVLALTGLLLLFLLLSRSTVAAAPDGTGTVSDLRPQDASFTISGTVTCQATGPISDVKVFVWNRDGSGGFPGGITDSSGAYSVTLKAGNYDLTFNPPCGHECASKGLKGITGPPDQIRNVPLTLGHTISGTVYGMDGNRVEDVSIYAFNHETADGFGVGLTDASGHYCIGLITGTYDLGFTPPSCRGLGPKTVVISLNEDTPLNVTLPPGFTVAGRVTDGASHPVSGVQIYGRECYTWTGYGFSPSNADGYYTGTLPLGTFGIQFLPPANRGLGPKTTPNVTSTTPGCPNTTRNVTLPEGFTISGRVTCQGEPVKNVSAYADPAGPSPDCYGLDEVGVYAVDDGSYGLPLVSGSYTLTFTPPPAAGLNAKAFTTTQIIADTMLDVDFCICSGAWVTETVDSAGNVGADNSLALKPTFPYAPRISYRQIVTDQEYNLKYAWLNGNTWLSQTVDSGGQWASLALVPTHPYTPCISHHHWEESVLKYTYRNSISWTTKIIAHARANKGSLALEPIVPYRPHISLVYPEEWGHHHFIGTAWMSGTWAQEKVSDLGWPGSLALEPTYPHTPHISFFDGADDDLKHAWLSDTTWFSETVENGRVGKYTSLALDGSGRPRIGYFTYFDDTNVAVKYAWLSGTVWLSETVDNVAEPNWRGRSISLDLDRADAPHLSYYDAAHDDLRYAHFDGTVWIIQTVDKVDSGGPYGQYSSLALDRVGCPHISYYDYEPNYDLKYAYIPTYFVYLPLVMRNHP